MGDADWRPSSCPMCGHYRAAARNPVCANPDCVTQPIGERTMKPGQYRSGERVSDIKKQPTQYVWIRSDGTVSIIDDPVEIYQSPDFDKDGDRIHRLGEEVEIRVTVEVKNKTVYRESSYPEGTR